MPTISIHKGKGSLTHNDRTIRNVSSASRSWNPELSNQNIVYVNKKIEDVYSELFDKSTANYNFKQKQKGHSERCITSYFEKIKNSKQEKTNYELVVQVGDIYDKNSTELNKIQQCLDEYNRSFQERNPNFIVFQQITHRDEKGMEHTHINFVPISKGNKRGLETKNSFSGALTQMGFGRKGFFQWREREQNALIDIMREHGLEFEHGSGRSEHLSIVEYQEVTRIAEKKAEQLLQNTENPNLDNIKPQFKTNPLTKKQTVVLEKADFDKIQVKLREQSNQISLLDLDKRVLSDKIENRDVKLAEMRKKPYTLENERLTHAKNDLMKQNNIKNAKIDQLQDHISQLEQKNNQLLLEKQNLTNQSQTLKKEINELTPYKVEYAKAVDTNKGLKLEINAVRSEYKRLKQEVDFYPNLKSDNQSLKTQLSEEKNKTRQLTSEVAELKKQNQALKNTLKKLVDQLKDVSQTLRFVLDYVENPFREILDSVKYLTDNLLQRFKIEPKQLNYEIPYDVARNIQLDVEYKRGDDGKGIYVADTEIMLNEFDSISEAREWYDSADIENLCRSRSYDYER